MITGFDTAYKPTSSILHPPFYEGKTIRIQYENGNGRVTWRTIKVEKVYHGNNGYTYIRAYCSLRQEVRTFRADRVLDWVDENTEPVLKRSAPPAAAHYPHPTPEKKKKKSGSFLAGLASIGFTIFIAGVIFTLFEDDNSSYSHSAAMQQEEQRIAIMKMEDVEDNEAGKAAVSVQPVPTPPEVTITYREYRGYNIRVKTVEGISVYQVEATGGTYGSMQAAHIAVNVKEFINSTAIKDPRVLAMYAGADTDSNGHLSWKEIEEFQNWLNRTYKYKTNDVALRPDQFLDYNGGDCEDWALVTCGLLRFWGWNCQVASFAPEPTAYGHAITLVWSKEEPSVYRYYHYSQDFTMTGRTQRAGYYIPIDYQLVGDITDAMEDDWLMRNLWIPEEIYGNEM